MYLLSRLPFVSCLFGMMFLATLSGRAEENRQTAGWIEARARGAVADGQTLNTALFNQLVQELSAAGGGTLHFSAGNYLTGTIYLRSHVTLDLDAGATLIGSTEIRDYPENPAPYPGERLEYGRHALIHADGQTDVAILGTGRIQGQGAHPNFTKKVLRARGWSERDAYLNRPYGLSFIHCQRVRVEGIRLEDMAFWCQHYLDCDDVVVRGVSIDSRKYDYNNDGIDIDGSRNVRVSDCRFNVGDDAICLKAAYRDCENVVVTNCIASSLANGVKFGTASYGGFKNIAISNLVFDGIEAAGIALEIVDGGTLDGVSLNNITMREVGTAIFIRLGDRARSWLDGQPKPAVGFLRNVTISNIVARLRADVGPGASGSITGLPGHPVENIQLSQIQIIARGLRSLDTKTPRVNPVPEIPEAYPEYSMFGALPSSGLFLRHAAGVNLREVSFDFSDADDRSVLVCDDVERLVIDGLQAPALRAQLPVISFDNVRGARVVNAQIWECATLLDAGHNCREITLAGNRTGNTELTPSRQ